MRPPAVPVPGCADRSGAPGQPLLLRRSVRLPPESTSPAAARGLLREALVQADRRTWSDAAELACTEVVTNAVLHAHTPLEVVVEVLDEEVRVLVRDSSPVLPVQRDYDVHATTGRGMALVAALSREHGVVDAGPDGKTVWFVVDGRASEQTDEELLAAWGDAEWDLDGLDEVAPAPDEPQDPVVQLLGLPPTLWLAARQHHDALVRELVLHLADHGDDPELAALDVPAADLARSSVSRRVVSLVEQAQREGTAVPALPVDHPSPLPWVPARLDLALTVPGGDGEAFAALQDVLDTAERLAVAGRLLVEPGLPEVVAVRDWVCEQVIAQLAGQPPSPWGGADQERFTTTVHARPAQVVPFPELPHVTGSDRCVAAADTANRIAAVSAPLARLLGWEPADLVGRRVVALVPHRLREGHVAGFTRHLATGEAHILGVPLTLPVLHADGVTEVLCSFLVERETAESGQPVYLAWLDPV